ncbi:pre-rRNA processing protein Utp22 [Aspergillus piperis CBS 112811]|uniref:U3 small nucleolar RNA-associated protein 22 n=1 Tax=Aspergillus piperis CBS 112811 TaxID=1448313 RepID=A0A8G1VJ23_9EURO|nr:pre-rRNA processing protein Utp22 [Aspergillus piperis CBS 112811]RAH53857.1 pre-rRNA processing protein Utp22 [Aspergillus piperis CBS 112811]
MDGDYTTKRRRLSPSPDDSSRTQNNSAYSVSNRNNLTDSDAAKPSRDVSTLRTSGRAKNDRSAELALASGFYKSTFFKLQLDELLNGSRPNYDKQVSRLQETLHKLKSVIECLPDRPPKSTFEAEKELRGAHGITVPFPEPRPAKDTKYTVSYSKPTNINVVGSLSLKTGAKSDVPLTVDLAVTMPSALFQEKDYVNYRYFHKRAYYIASLAAGIREAEGLNLTVKFGLQDGDSLRPVLLLEPNGTERKDSLPAKTQIRIITAIEDSLFPISRTLPSRNNIRQGSADVPVSQESTPFYNAALRSEATVAQYHKFLYNAARNCESFKDACILGRTWLRQRGLGSSPFKGGFGGFEWTVLMALLFEGGGPNGKPVLLKSYSSYQLFKATLQFIAGRDLAIPLLFSATDISFPDGTPVLYDGKRGLNVLYKMAPWSYAFLRREANTTVRMLNESRDDNFDKVFIIKVNEPLLRFDRILKLPGQDSANILRSLRSQTAVYDVIVRALGDRADLVHIYGDVFKPWPVDEKPHRKPASQSVSVGLVLNTDNAERVVDHGPSAEQKEEAAAFRSFWGEKAELRRFKDGTIRESLVWTDEKSSPSIVYQILTYILSRHFNYTKDDVVFIGDEYDDKLREGGDDVFSYSSPAFQAITDAFTSVQRSIQDMDGVPLTVRHLAPASPSLRYTALRLHGTAGVASNPADIVLQFESSARWPDDLKAIQMTKVAFLIKIGDSLKSGGVASACRVGLENESTGLMNNSFLDITHTSGIVFRLRIHHEREQLLLERQLKEKGASPLAKQQVAYALAAYKRLFIQTPRLTQAIRTLCTRFPLLSPTIRLVKYWFNCHLLAGHVNQELIELLVVRVFTQSYPWDSPSSVMAGFLRTLHVLSRWDWQQEPLMVDFGELNKESMEAIQTRFSAWRSVDPAMNTVALFVASDIDTDGVTWTQHEMPPKVVAARMCTLAKAAMKLLREQGYGLTVSDLFHTSLAPYDFVINIRPGLLQERLALPTRFKNLDARKTARTAKPAMVSSFARDLQACYHPNMLLFHGDESCSVIGGLWNPQILKPKKWTLKLAYSTCPSEPRANEEVSMNCQAVLSEIARLGADLVDNIEVHTEVASEK